MLTADLRAQRIHDSTVEEAALLVTELVGNAVRYARPLPDDCLLVSWQVEARGVQIRVTDGGGLLDSPHLAYAGPRDTRGRGLSIVNALAAVWGVDGGAGSTTVWVVLPGSSPPPAPVRL